MEIKQTFSPAFKVFEDGKEWEIRSRVWDFTYSDDNRLKSVKHSHWLATTDGNTKPEKLNLLEIGARQIEEIWKHYKGTIWVSNYGYVADIPVEEAQKAFGAHRLEKFKHGFSFRTCNLPGEDGLYKVKDMLRQYNFVPINRKTAGYQINLYVKQVQEELHRIVANAFLVKPADSASISYSVHHIDNNSYHNCVTNLIYIKDDDHKNAHALLHPMSHFYDNHRYQTFSADGQRNSLQKTKEK